MKSDIIEENDVRKDTAQHKEEASAMIPESDPTRSFHHRMKQHDRLISFLHRIIRYAVKVLAVLMTLVILWGVVDVIWIIYQRIRTPPVFILNINDILATFGGFLAVLIAMEIFVNIIMYLEAQLSG